MQITNCVHAVGIQNVLHTGLSFEINQTLSFLTRNWEVLDRNCVQTTCSKLPKGFRTYLGDRFGGSV